MNLAPRKIPLGKAEYLVFDLSNDVYRVAYYKPVYQVGELKGHERITVRRRKLSDALQVVLGEGDAVHSVETVEHYIRNRRWGRELP